jgi:ERCC4-type nuclease
MAKKSYGKFTIIRDSREKDGAGWNFRASANCHGVEIRKLDTGDYSLKGYEDIIMIERKTIGDLWGTLTFGRERFMKEMERALEYPIRFLIIEGTVKDIDNGFRYSKVSPEFIHASLISLQVKYGVHVIFTDKRTDVAQSYVRNLLAKLFQYCEDGVISKNGRPPNSTKGPSTDNVSD